MLSKPKLWLSRSTGAGGTALSRYFLAESLSRSSNESSPIELFSLDSFSATIDFFGCFSEEAIEQEAFALQIDDSTPGASLIFSLAGGSVYSDLPV